jgi:two-component system chemotaxis response regulator CheY
MSGIKFPIDQISILIVDDHDLIRKAMKAVVASIGIVNIFEATDGGDAIAQLEKRPIDLVLCDLYMRKVSGLTVLTHVRNRAIGSDIPFIVVTGEASKEDIVKTSDLGANEYILKPFQTDALEQKIVKVLNEFFSPSTLLRLMRTGDKQILKNDFEGALITFRSALNLDPESLRAKHSSAVVLLLMGHEKEAQKMLEKNIRESNSYYRNYVTLANLHLKRKDLPEAIKTITLELELHPKQASRQALLGKLMLQQGDIDGAINHFREALKENAKHEPSLMGMGQAFAKKGDVEKGLYYFKRLRRHRPDSTKALVAGVKCCMDLNEPKKAEMMLRDEKQRYPERVDVYTTLAKFYSATDRYDEAFGALNELFVKSPDNPEGLKIKASLEMKTKKFALAAATFKIIAKLAPTVEIFIALADCSEKIGLHKDAIAALTRCLVLDNRNSQAVFRLGVAFFKTNQFMKAQTVFLRARILGWDSAACAKYISQCIRLAKERRAAPNLIAS